ncbi:hypothetical protein R1flu_023454 [Riccia fluitans]|uniref:peptidyl-tRNA hydrolase n=1 Tax=Riccia fluitans TaxID=41844 RepID=A0ABD1XS34_9MARC
MNLRSALRPFVETSHSPFFFPTACITTSSPFLTRWTSPHNSGPRKFTSCSSHLSQFSDVSNLNRRLSFGRFSSRPAGKSSSDSGASLPCSVVHGNFRSSAIFASPMSQSANPPSLQALSLQESEPRENAEAGKDDVLVQYIVIRKDLVLEQNWPLGSVISQGCHAAVAAIWLHKDDPETGLYCGPENLDHMHKVTLEVKGETQLRNLAQKLETAGVAHKLWIEQPENYATCLATKPYHKSQVASHFKKLKLCK